SPLLDRTGDLESRNVGGARGRRITAQPLEDVGTIDAGGDDLDQHFACRGRRPGTLRRHEHVRVAGMCDFNRDHVSSPNAARAVAGSRTTDASNTPTATLSAKTAGRAPTPAMAIASTTSAAATRTSITTIGRRARRRS